MGSGATGPETPAEARLRFARDELRAAEAALERLPLTTLSADEARHRVEAARMAIETELERQRMRKRGE